MLDYLVYVHVVVIGSMNLIYQHSCVCILYKYSDPACKFVTVL